MPDGSYSEMMRICTKRKDVHGFKVFSNDRTNKSLMQKKILIIDLMKLAIMHITDTKMAKYPKQNFLKY